MASTSFDVDEQRWIRVDDHHIAYRMRGRSDGVATVLYCTGMFLPIEAMWEDPEHARLLDGLAALGRVVVYDRRGVGASDPVSSWEEPIIHQWVRDAEGVAERCGGPVHLFGWEWGSLQALLLAQHRPDLVASVTIFHGIDRPERLEHVFGMPLPDLATFMSSWVLGEAPAESGSLDVTGDMYHATRAGDPAFDRWIEAAGRRGASPSTAARVWRSLCTPGTGVDHEAIRCPVLVLRRRGCTIVPLEATADLTASLPDGRLIELPGTDLAPYADDVEPLLAEVQRFVAGELPVAAAEGERVLCGVLFTDIVDSTADAARLGDRRWRGVLDEHDRITERVVGRHRGRVVKHTGDGALAMFPLASSALAAALDLREELASIGLVIRQAVHVGEVVDRGSDVAGMAVHVAARLLPHALDGEIAVTEAVPLVTGSTGAEFTVRGTTVLRGVPGTWTILVATGPR